MGADLIDELDDEQKRRLRALRRGFRAESVEVIDNGWKLQIRYQDGSKVLVDAKAVKIKAKDLG